MKINKLRFLRRVAPIAIGVFLGRGAQADTTLTFDCTAVANHAPLLDCVPPQTNNPNSPPGITNYGNFAAASSPGIAVSGFGTPNIGLTWGSDNFPDTRWEYYNTSGGPWGDGAGGSGVVQLQDSIVGSTEQLTFTPNNPSVSVVVKSFAFFAYYNDNERFTYNVRVVSGTNVLSSQTISYLSDGTKNHPVNINYTGGPGQTLKLQLRRVASTLGAGEIEGNEYNNAVDDIKFAQTPASTLAGGPQVASVTPADGTGGLPATNTPPYAAIITNSPTLSVAAPIALKLDYAPVSPPPTITPGVGQTSVTYPGAAALLSSGLHVYTLTYADNLGGIYTNEVVFSTIYTTLPAAYALPPGSGVVRGFTFRTVSADTQVSSPTTLDSSISRAEAQLNGTLINTNTSMPYTNDATLGTNADGSFNIDTVLNFTGDGVDEGDFTGDQPFPGLPFFPNRWFSSEGLLYLDLPAGYYRLGVNSDDGFEVTATPPQGISGPPIVTGVFDNGRGPADTLFDVLVPTSGVYPFRLVYFQSSGGSECEFFSVTNLTTGDKILINDSPANAVKSFRVLAPHIVSIVKSGTDAIVHWAYGTPPYQVQFKTNLTDAVWNNFGAPIASTTTNVPIQPSTKFIRVFYVQP